MVQLHLFQAQLTEGQLYAQAHVVHSPQTPPNLVFRSMKYEVWRQDRRYEQGKVCGGGKAVACHQFRPIFFVALQLKIVPKHLQERISCPGDT